MAMLRVPISVLDALETDGPGWLFQGFRAILTDMTAVRAEHA